jgi:hypothetical protein
VKPDDCRLVQSKHVAFLITIIKCFVWTVRLVVTDHVSLKTDKVYIVFKTTEFVMNKNVNLICF